MPGTRMCSNDTIYDCITNGKKKFSERRGRSGKMGRTSGNYKNDGILAVTKQKLRITNS